MATAQTPGGDRPWISGREIKGANIIIIYGGFKPTRREKYKIG
jgi:hypothetical protein